MNLGLWQNPTPEDPRVEEGWWDPGRSSSAMDLTSPEAYIPYGITKTAQKANGNTVGEPKGAPQRPQQLKVAQRCGQARVRPCVGPHGQELSRATDQWARHWLNQSRTGVSSMGTNQMDGEGNFQGPRRPQMTSRQSERVMGS